MGSYNAEKQFGVFKVVQSGLEFDGELYKTL